MMQRLPKKADGDARARYHRHCALCAGCLLLCAVMLAACAFSAPDTSGVSQGTEAPAASHMPGAGEPPPASGQAGTGRASSDAGNVFAPTEAFSDAAEANGDSMADGEDICGLPLAPGGTEFPEADRAAALTGGTAALYLDAREFMLGTDEEIGYTVENTTGHEIGVVFVPRLERWTNGVWLLWHTGQHGENPFGQPAIGLVLRAYRRRLPSYLHGGLRRRRSSLGGAAPQRVLFSQTLRVAFRRFDVPKKTAVFVGRGV